MKISRMEATTSDRIENPHNVELGINDTLYGYTAPGISEYCLRAEGFFQDNGIWYANIKWYNRSITYGRLVVVPELPHEDDPDCFIEAHILLEPLSADAFALANPPDISSYPRGLQRVFSAPMGGWILYQTNVFPIGTPGCYQGIYSSEEEAWTTAWLLAGVLVLVTEYGMDEGRE